MQLNLPTPEQKDDFIDEILKVCEDYQMCLGIDTYDNSFWIVNHIDPIWLDRLRKAYR